MSRMDVYKLISEQCLKITKAEPTKGNKMNTPNRHAALMRQYTEELIFDPHAYKNWERKYVGDSQNYWLVCNTHPMWGMDREYRRKAKTITIGNIEVPEPMQVAPEIEKHYFVAVPRSPDLYGCARWYGDNLDWAALTHGMCHKTKEAAIAHATAIIIASGGKVEE